MVETEKHGEVTVLKLASPQTKNALDLEMAESLLAAAAGAQADPECRVIILTAAGRVFSSGPDVAGLLRLLDEPDGVAILDRVVSTLNRFIHMVYTSPKLSIAAMNGYAFGGGLNITLACDYRMAVERATFIESFAHMGLTPDLSSSFFLPRLLGPARAGAVLWTGRLFTAQEALQWGLLHEVVSTRVELESRMLDVARQMALGAPEVVPATRRLLRRGEADLLMGQLELEKELLLEAFQRRPTVRERLQRLVVGAT